MHIELWDFIVTCLHSRYPEAVLGALALLSIPVLIVILLTLCLLDICNPKK